MRQLIALAAASLLLLLGGCTSNLDLISIDEYISQNNLEVETTASGLKYIIEFEGNNEMPTLDDEVTVKYRGYRTDDFTFDSNIEGLAFPLENVIEGWQEGIQLLGKGGKAQLFIPSNLAYGNGSPSSDIPPNTDLIFDVELVNF